MKNKIKKIAALVFALALMASTASTAFAAHGWPNGDGEDNWDHRWSEGD